MPLPAAKSTNSTGKYFAFRNRCYICRPIKPQNLMKINHLESGSVFEITEQKGTFKLHDSTTNKSHFFRESYEAIWHSIELIRNISFEYLHPGHLLEIARRSRIPEHAISPSLVPALKKEKIIRTYYDQIFLKLLSFYRSGQDLFTVSNQSNFIIDHEVTTLLKTTVGLKLSVPQ